MHLMPPSCRSRFSERDFDFIASVLGGHDVSGQDPLFRLFRDPDTLNLILDQPGLLEAVTEMRTAVEVSAELYFYVLVRHALRESGIDHREVADYVAAILAEFSRGNPFRFSAGEELRVQGMPYHVDFLEEIQSASAHDQFYLHVRCGNQFLVLTGLFPDFIERRKQRKGAPGVPYYESVARQSYRSAGGHPLADEFTLGEVYTLLADQFRAARRALNLMAREYLWLGA